MEDQGLVEVIVVVWAEIGEDKMKTIRTKKYEKIAGAGPFEDFFKTKIKSRGEECSHDNK